MINFYSNGLRQNQKNLELNNDTIIIVYTFYFFLIFILYAFAPKFFLNKLNN